uniref:SFRICE_013116 n=1 Tax=Spodoptera frugiperda TaxID=7108 RepID=A0A2H1W7L7_SPOFR
MISGAADYLAGLPELRVEKQEKERDEIWKLTRTPHLKDTDAVKLDQAIANYSLQDTPFFTFNNTEDTCRVNGGNHLDSSTLIMTSAAALALFRRFY